MQIAEPVLVHDWPQDAIGQAIPYRVYEFSANQGLVCVGDCLARPAWPALPHRRLANGGSSRGWSAMAIRIAD